jgi:histidyl-tRNA synthetase
MGAKEEIYCLKAMQEIRSQGIATEIYPEPVKLKKQMEYADKRNIPFVVIAGEVEMASEKFILKNMYNKSQKELSLQRVLDELKSSN